MALIKCRECGKEISEQAKICPNCGLIIKSRSLNQSNEGWKHDYGSKFTKFLRIFGISILTITIISAAYILYNHTWIKLYSSKEITFIPSMFISAISSLYGGITFFSIFTYMAVSIEQKNEIISRLNQMDNR